MFLRIPEDEIDYINRVYLVKSQAYLKRIRSAEDFDDYSFSADGKLRGVDAPRPFCILDFQTWLAQHSVPTQNVLVTHKPDPEVALLPPSAVITEARYEDGHDLHTINLPQKNFDLAIVSQTLEHVYNPTQVMERICAHLKPGGYFFTSVPTTNIPHDTPFHFQQFYPAGLATLGMQTGFDIVEMGFWGNQEYLLKLFSTYEWTDIYGLDDLTADPRYPVACWALFRKSQHIYRGHSSAT
jgi:SAM-dependent methyltransferase